jgi:hypothetical protein
VRRGRAARLISRQKHAAHDKFGLGKTRFDPGSIPASGPRMRSHADTAPPWYIWPRGCPPAPCAYPANRTLETIHTRTPHDENENVSLVACRGHRACRPAQCLGARVGAVVHSGLADQADPADRPPDPRQCDRRDVARSDGSGLGADRTAGHRRKSSRRRQHHRHGGGREGGAGRLHRSRQFLDPHRDPGDPLESGVRDDRPRPHRPARQYAGRHGVQSVEGLQKAQRLRRGGEGKAGLGQLRVGGRRKFVASQR